MSDLFVALGLVLAVEGLVFAAFPGPTKRMMAQVLETPEGSLRFAGILSALVGVLLIWIVRG